MASERNQRWFDENNEWVETYGRRGTGGVMNVGECARETERDINIEKLREIERQESLRRI